MGRAKEVAAAFASLAVFAFGLFLWCARTADSAMDKTGIGDLARFQHYSGLAGLSFWAVVLFWILCVAATQFAPRPFRGRALFGFGVLLPLAFGVAYMFVIWW